MTTRNTNVQIVIASSQQQDTIFDLCTRAEMVHNRSAQQHHHHTSPTRVVAKCAHTNALLHKCITTNTSALLHKCITTNTSALLRPQVHDYTCACQRHEWVLNDMCNTMRYTIAFIIHLRSMIETRFNIRCTQHST